VVDLCGAESIHEKEAGLGLLDMTTAFSERKLTSQVHVVISSADGTIFAQLNGESGVGYEIHMGQSSFGTDCVPFTCSIGTDNIKRISGISNVSGTVTGTYVHGFMDASNISTGLVNALRKKKGLLPLDEIVNERATVLERDINGLAAVVRESVDIPHIYRIAGLEYDAG
jgi:adenosylcobyric acid synthase